MARPGVTYEDIAAAASQVKSEGRNPTIENVRAILGTGSIGTINNHLRKWKEVQSGTQKLASKENLPEALVASLKGLWGLVVNQAEDKISSLEAIHEEDQRALREEVDKYKANNQRWQKLFHQWQEEKGRLSNDKLELEHSLKESQAENLSLSGKLEALLKQLEEKQERVQELHRLHKQAQENLEHYRETLREERLLDLQQFEQQKQQMLAENKLLKEEAGKLQGRLARLEEGNLALKESCQQLEKRHAEIQKENTALKAELLAAEKKQQEYNVLYKNARGQQQVLQKTVDEQSRQIIHDQAENKSLIKEVGVLKNGGRELKNQLKLIAQEKWEIAQEKAELQGQLKQALQIRPELVTQGN